MIPFILQQSLVSLWLLTTTSMAGWMNSPMSWSPDGEWLGYTAVLDPGRNDWGAGWLFDTNSWDGTARDATAVGDRKSTARSPVYQIWVAHPNNEASVLVEEARWPLTAPSWSPRGKAIAFGRFVPQSMEPTQSAQRGRFEVVIQDAMKRKRVFWASQEFELDDQTRACFPQLALAWSPNGRFLAISQPGREPSILIMGTDSAKVLATLEHATLPVWSPDGSQCASSRPRTAPTASGWSSAAVKPSRRPDSLSRRVRSRRPRAGAMTASGSSRSSRSPRCGRASWRLIVSHPGPEMRRGF